MPRPTSAFGWATILYVVSDTARTVRFCAILLAASIPLGSLAMLIIAMAVRG